MSWVGGWIARGLGWCLPLPVLLGCASAPRQADAPVASPPPGSASVPGPGGMRPAYRRPVAPVGPDLSALAEAMRASMRRHRVCDASLALLGGAGAASPVLQASQCGAEAATTATGPPVFQAASLSKPVFAWLVLKLVQQGKLALDAPLLAYLPRTAHPPSAAASLARMTVRMALNHSSGLPNAGGSGGWNPVFEPGARWQYSGQGYLLLQRAVEQVTGQGLHRVASELLFGPLGMASSSFVWQDHLAPRLVPGRSAQGQPLPQRRFVTPHAAATLITTAGDYARFMAAMLRDELVLDLVLDQPVPVDRALNLHWGLGWGLEAQADDVLLWQWGHNPGYKALAVAAVGSGQGFVLLTNGEAGLQVARELAPLLMGEAPALLRFRMLN